MERKISVKLLQWKESDRRKPLILKGARQVGKTYSCLMFGKEHYKNVVYLNFDNNDELEAVFRRNYDTNRIIGELSNLSGQTIFKHDTLIIFDEIQSSELALNSLKYFNENNNDYHIIAAGCRVGSPCPTNKDVDISFPVGKVDTINMYPLSFEEFLVAIDKKGYIQGIRESFLQNIPFSLHESAMDLYRTYLAVGGMPSAVVEYIEKKDFNFVLANQKSIDDNYIADMAKYATASETIKTIEVYKSLPAQLAKENKKFQYKLIKSGARAYDYEIPITWLSSSGIVNKISKVREGRLPITAFAEYNTFKLYMGDTGLLCSKLAIPAQKILSKSSDMDFFKGTLAENYVSGELKATGHECFYWESNGIAEVDFVFQDSMGDVIPVEVKSGENVRSKSLNVFMSRYESEYAIRISAKNFGFENNIKSVPLYAVFCI